MQIPHDDPRLLPISLRGELVRAGYTDRSLARAVQGGALARPRRGAYVDGPLWRSMNKEQQYAVRCRAAYLQARTGVVLSHVSALPFCESPLWGFDLGTTHLTRADGFAGRREAAIQRHRGLILPGDVVENHGLLFMAPLRATLEASLVGSVEASLAVANHFLHAGEFSAEDLFARYHGTIEYWPDSLATSLMLRLIDPRIESVGESRTYYFLYRHGLPKPIPQFEVYDQGVMVARLDFAFPDLGFWIEFDGRAKYEKFLRPGETPADAVIREKARESLVQELTGWRCMRITWADLADPAGLERRIRRLMESIASERARRKAS